MKIIAFEVRDDEKDYFKKYEIEYKCEITCVSETLTHDNISMVKVI